MTTTFPPPTAFGLPKAFASWRPDQVTAFQLILDSPYRHIGLTMPTGSGKSLAYMSAMVIGGGRGVALTSTKGLQDQLSADFSEVGVVDVRGQRNYPCLALRHDGEWANLHAGGDVAGCDEGPCHAGLTCGLKEAGCGYYDRVRQAQTARVVSTNYATWLAHRRYSGGLGGCDLLVLDEAHQAVDELAQALTITVEKWLLKAVGVDTEPQTGLLQVWKDWGAFHALRLRKRLEGLGKPTTGAEVKYRRRVKAAERALSGLSEMEVGNWVEDHTPEAWRFEVLNPARYAEGMLFQGAKKVVLVSATLTPKTLALLGVHDDFQLWECPSRFPVARRPVIYIPTCPVDTRMKPEHWDVWMGRIDQVLDQRQTVKGVIHTVSYKRRDVVLARSGHADRMVTHQSKDLAPRVLGFKKDPKPRILVSPSVMTGWDFPYDQCRYQIIAKLPFPDTRSKILKARSEVDPDYLPYLTMQALVQAVGRGMRAEDDWCETLVVDDHARWFLPKYRRLAPKWFMEAVRTSLTVPKPLKF